MARLRTFASSANSRQAGRDVKTTAVFTHVRYRVHCATSVACPPLCAPAQAWVLRNRSSLLHPFWSHTLRAGAHAAAETPANNRRC